MSKITWIPIDLIDDNKREHIAHFMADEFWSYSYYVQFMKKLPPVVLSEVDGRYYFPVQDGQHRYNTALRMQSILDEMGYDKVVKIRAIVRK